MLFICCGHQPDASAFVAMLMVSTLCGAIMDVVVDGMMVV